MIKVFVQGALAMTSALFGIMFMVGIVAAESDSDVWVACLWAALCIAFSPELWERGEERGQ